MGRLEIKNSLYTLIIAKGFDYSAPDRLTKVTMLID